MTSKSEEVDVSSISGASADAHISGVLGDISPMKKGRGAAYFDGEMLDEKKKVRLYGFDSSVRKRLMEETGNTVVLGNCEVKKARYSNEYEVFVGKNTVITKSLKNYNIEQLDDTKTTALNELSDIPEYSKINCESKVFQVDDATSTSTGKKLQNVVVGDGHGVAKMSLWEDDVGKVTTSKSYRFEKVVVKEYRGQTQLSTATNSVIMSIDDLDVEMTECLTLLPSVIQNAKVIGVLAFEKYSKCMKCSAKIMDTQEFDTCDKCGMVQCISECQTEVAAKLMIRHSSSNERLMLKAYGSILEEIAEEVVCSPLVLLKAKPFTATYGNQDGIIQSISRV